MLNRVLSVAAAALALLFVACGDDTCTRTCAPGQACVLSDGVELCLAANCGGQACAPGTTCVEDVCVDDVSCTGCTASQHCVSGVCVDNYTSDNVCDPLPECREGCGTRASCLAACEADRSASCQSCADDLVECARDANCTPGSVNNCCEDTFCRCFPSEPGCGNVPDCFECQADCGDDTDCFNECRGADLACNLCLQPFDDCVEENGQASACIPEFCSCLDPELETACQ